MRVPGSQRGALAFHHKGRIFIWTTYLEGGIW